MHATGHRDAAEHRPGATRAVLRLGTRASQLARTQSALVAELLSERTGRDVVLVPVAHRGRRQHRAALSSLGGTGVFVSALREALLAGEVDLAVHSLKDLPTAPAEGDRPGCGAARGGPP